MANSLNLDLKTKVELTSLLIITVLEKLRHFSTREVTNDLTKQVSLNLNHIALYI